MSNSSRTQFASCTLAILSLLTACSKPGVPDGQSFGSYATGEKQYEVTVVDGKFHGPWLRWYPGGQVAERGIYDSDLAEGAWEYWYENGLRKAFGSYRNDAVIGRWTYYYESGIELHGSYDSKGSKIGSWTWIRPTGELWMELKYTEPDQVDKKTVWHSDGRLCNHATKCEPPPFSWVFRYRRDQAQWDHGALRGDAVTRTM